MTAAEGPGSAATPPIPVTVVTGFLGAGKTTLLGRMLSDPGPRRYAVIVNEFAELGIDDDLLLESQEEIITLTNGCVCCNVRGDLLRSLRSIVARGVAYDAILVETTGLADPGPILQTFYMDPQIAGRVRLDSVVTVADVRHVRGQLGQAPEAAAQIAAADLILLNKNDLLSAEEVDGVEAEVRAINPFASVRRAAHAALPPSDVFDRRAFDLGRVVERMTAPAAGGARHASGVGSVSLRVDPPLDLDRFLRWIDSVIALHGEDVMRVKGILNISGEARPFVFQAVHRIMEGDFRTLGRAGVGSSKLVVIGRHLEPERLRRNLDGCQAWPRDLRTGQGVVASLP